MLTPGNSPYIKVYLQYFTMYKKCAVNIVPHSLMTRLNNFCDYK
jgi:hypothetical protein